MPELFTNLIGGAFKSGFDNLIGYFREGQAREENYRYNEMAANNADKRTRALYNDLYSPAAQLAQLKKAGLSPSLFYGDGGGIAGQTGAMSAGGGSVSPSVFGIDPMTLAQTKLMEMQAYKAKQEGDAVKPTAEASIKQMLADAGYKEAASKAQEAAAEYQNIKTTIETEGKKWTLQEMEWRAKKFQWNAEQAFWEYKDKELEYNFNEETFNSRMLLVDKQVQQITADILLKNAQTNLAIEQQEQIKQAVLQRWEELRLKAVQLAQMKESIDNQKKFWDDSISNFQKALAQDLEKFGKSLTQGYIKMGVDAVTSLVNGNLLGGLLGGLLDGGKPAAGNVTTTSGAWE